MRMPKTLSLGKVRGLQQISDANGIFAVCAMDHRQSMQRMIDQAAPERITRENLSAVKCELADALSPACTAILLDPVHGAAGRLPRVVRRARPELWPVVDDARVPTHFLCALRMSEQVRIVAQLPHEDQVHRGHVVRDERAAGRGTRERSGRDAEPAGVIGVGVTGPKLFLDDDVDFHPPRLAVCERPPPRTEARLRAR